MRKFLFDVTKFSILFATLSVLVTILIYLSSGDNESYYEENEICLIKQKLEVTADKYDELNTFFIGTSMLFRHIIPTYFDSITGTTNSYNYGVDAFSFPRPIDFAVNLSGKVSDESIFFIEATAFVSYFDNYKNSAVINSIGLKRYPDLFNVRLDRADTNKFYSRFLDVDLATPFLYKYFGFGVGRRIENLTNQEIPYNRTSCFDELDMWANRGFIALDEQVAFKQGDWEPTHNRRVNFLKESKNYSLTDLYKADPNEPAPRPESVASYINVLQEGLELINPRVKKVIFVLPIRVHSNDAPLLHSVRDQLEKEGYQVIDFTDPAAYPELYEEQYTYDKIHLNKSGARIYTQYLAAEFLQGEKE